MESALKGFFLAGKGVYTMKVFSGGDDLHHRRRSVRAVFSFPYTHSISIGMKSRGEVSENIRSMGRL